MSNDTFNDLLADSAAAFKFETIGDTCKGRVVRAERRQQTDPDGSPKTFPSGDPMMQLVVTVEQDDGTEAALYFKGGKYDVAEGDGTSALAALQEAVKGQDFKVGGTLAMRYSGNGKKTNPAFNAPKLYRVQYRQPEPTIDLGESLI